MSDNEDTLKVRVSDSVMEAGNDAVVHIERRAAADARRRYGVFTERPCVPAPGQVAVGLIPTVGCCAVTCGIEVWRNDHASVSNNAVHGAKVVVKVTRGAVLDDPCSAGRRGNFVAGVVLADKHGHRV